MPNEPAWPVVNVADAGLVMAGGWSTVSTNDCVAAVPTPFVALIEKSYTPPVPDAGVPARVPAPPLLSVNVTPEGSVPVPMSEGAG